MARHITLCLDDESEEAARQLAMRYGCSTSEAIRRAVVRHRDAVFGVPARSRKERGRILESLFNLFEGHDADSEVRRLKGEDGGF